MAHPSTSGKAHSSTKTIAKEDIISSLIKQPFHTRTSEQQLRVLHTGRPTPVLEKFFMKSEKAKMSQRDLGFREGLCAFMYQNYPWLAGERETEKLFCWPCLLTSKGTEKNDWVDGTDHDMDSLAQAAESHGGNKKHLENVAIVTGAVDKLNAALLANFHSKFPHLGKKATNNRELLRKLVEVAMIVYKFELSVEYLATDWVTAEKFEALFNLVAGGNENVVQHSRAMGNDFTRMIRTFFHDFLDCIQDKIQRNGFQEIVQCDPRPLCSVQVDSIRDVDAGKNSLVSIMMGYVNKKGVYRQHFFGFESNTERSAATVSRNMEIAMVRYRDVAISQSYDGACVLLDDLTNLTKKIRITSPYAVFIPSVDHPLNTLLMQGVSNVRGVQLFVMTIQDLVQNPKQLKVLAQLMAPNAESPPEPDWTIDSKFMSFLLDERESIISAYEDRPASVSLSVEMAVKMKRLVNNLQDLTFMFLVIAFVDVLKVTDVLADVVGRRLSDVDRCSDTVSLTVSKLKQLKKENKARQYLERANKICIPAKNPKANPSGLATIFDLAIDNIVFHLQARFGEVKQLRFLQLTDPDKFASHAETFPLRAFISLDQLYGNHFHMKRLEMELKSFLYINPLFRTMSATDFIKLIHERGLNETVPEIYKLFCLTVTLPTTAVPGRDCFRQIQSFMCEARRHNYEKYENHRALPTMGLSSVLIKHAQVVIERPHVLELFAEEGFRDGLMKQYVEMKKESGVKFDCAL